MQELEEMADKWKNLMCEHQLLVPDAKGEGGDLEKKARCQYGGAAVGWRIGTPSRGGLGLPVHRDSC